MKIFILSLFSMLSFSIWSQSENQLTLYAVPSPLGLDWSSPRSIALSALKNRLSFKPRFIGHVFIEVQCDEKKILTGMTGKKFDYMNQLLIEQRGLGIMYHSFEGELENQEEIGPELLSYLKSGYANFTRFLINENQCQRISTYLNEYKKNNVGRHYGLAHRPRYGEGAGCSAFAVSFPQVLDILDQEMREAWSQTILIPKEYAGPPITDKSVGLFKILIGANRWANSNEEHFALTFWDPDKINSWIKEKVALKQSSYKVINIENAQGVIFDKTHLPLPSKPIWLQSSDPIYSTGR